MSHEVHSFVTTSIISFTTLALLSAVIIIHYFYCSSDNPPVKFSYAKFHSGNVLHASAILRHLLKVAPAETLTVLANKQSFLFLTDPHPSTPVMGTSRHSFGRFLHLFDFLADGAVV